MQKISHDFLWNSKILIDRLIPKKVKMPTAKEEQFDSNQPFNFIAKAYFMKSNCFWLKRIYWRILSNSYSSHKKWWLMVVCIRIHRLIKVKKELILNWIQYKSFFEQSKLNILETCFTSLKIHINTKKTPFGLIDYKKTRLIDYPQKMILKANKKLSIQSSFFNEAKILVIKNNNLDFDQ